MVLKGKIRGFGRQLASYLLAKGENDEVRILDVDGMESFTDIDLRIMLRDFSLNEQLTKSRQGIYHASINPEEGYEMSDKDWFQATDMLAEALGFEEQRRVIVLHRKHGRTHAHVAFERYDHEKKRMIAIDHNFRKQNKVRGRMEQVFKQQPTPERNLKRPAMKAALTALWKETPNAHSFIQRAREQGYGISTGFDRTPFMVVDETGRSFNLVRHLDGVKLKEVRERFKDMVLLSEKEAIAFARTQEDVTGRRARIKTRQEAELLQKRNGPGKEKSVREAFQENLERQRNKQQAARIRRPRLK